MDWVAGALSGLSGALVLYAVKVLARTADSVTRLERKVDVLVRHAGIDVRAVAAHEAGVLAGAGRTVEAIRVYRELTGDGLAEAKAAVEKL